MRRARRLEAWFEPTAGALDMIPKSSKIDVR
jgi:hypothetical protein